jgi:endonuclease/exonuclease/phosphatase family metal-dependent hydrolase
MNSQGASKAPQQRHKAAHARQAREASIFIDATHDDRFPVVFGGDFNMRESKPRWENFSPHQSLKLVHQVCQEPNSGCDVRMSWDGDAPWMDTQDLQFFWSGSPVAVAPIRIESMFDGSPGSPKLSDHDGLLVTYRLAWPARMAGNPAC